MCKIDQCPDDFTRYDRLFQTSKCLFKRDNNLFVTLTGFISVADTARLTSEKARIEEEFEAIRRQYREYDAAAPPEPEPERVCPPEWFPSPDNAEQCYARCPSGYTFHKPGIGIRENGEVDTTPSCVFNTDPTLYITAASLNVNSSQTEFAGALNGFNARVTDYNQNVVGRKQRINAARDSLLTAENQRATDPDGYQQARVNYYTLLQGSEWKTDEEERVLETEIKPQINKYLSEISALSAQISSQNQLSDAVRGSADKILGSKNDFKFIASAFSTQLDKLNAETEQQKREAADREKLSLLWFDNIINWALILFLVAFIFLVAYYAYDSYSGGDIPKAPTVTISTKPTG
jgi:hypothetical protein